MATIAFRMQLKPGAADEYRKRHDAIWPELVTLLRDAGIYDYSIFLDPESLSLFAVLKLAPGHRRDRLAHEPLMQRWWVYMADLMVTNRRAGSDEGDVSEGNSTPHRPREWPLELMFHMD